MTHAKPKKPASDVARMKGAKRRLEELLANPGPGIKVTPIVDPDDIPPPPPPQQAKSAAQPASAESSIGSVHPQPAAQRVDATSHAPANAQRQNHSPPAAPPNSRAATHARTSGPPASLLGRLIAFIEGPQTPQPSHPADKPENTGTRLRPPGERELDRAIVLSKQAFIGAGLFSFVINILMLAGPLFMLQVYDRVMTSGSIPTLVALTVMTAGLYAIMGALELVRSRVIVRIGLEVDQRISQRIFEASLKRSLQGTAQSTQALRELDQLRQFLASPGPLTFFDAPWTPIYLLVIFLMHWMLGVAAAIGAVLILSIAWASEVRSRLPVAEANRAAHSSFELAETGQRNAEAITAMGMMNAYRERWQVANQQALSWQSLAADRLGGMSAISKSLRLLGQSLMLAIGAALALAGEISAGAIVAGTIIFGRALAPVEQAIAHWRPFLKAREAYANLNTLLERIPPLLPKTALPAPKGVLQVNNLRVAAPESQQLILANIAFKVEPGQMVAIIGPSASGKSTLVRALVGLWPPAAGTITLDGARLDQWHAEDLGKHIGYLPQNVDMFAGSVRENIGRFCPDATDEEVVTAAKQAHTHDLILNLPQGYDTQLGAFGKHLSAGQRQRIALARAMFRDPALVVLDEPNANLDRPGDVALASAIDGMRARGQTVILVSHRVQAIGKANLLLYIDRGVQRAFGSRDEVMKMFSAGRRATDPDFHPLVEPERRRSPDGAGEASI